MDIDDLLKEAIANIDQKDIDTMTTLATAISQIAIIGQNGSPGRACGALMLAAGSIGHLMNKDQPNKERAFSDEEILNIFHKCTVHDLEFMMSRFGYAIWYSILIKEKSL